MAAALISSGCLRTAWTVYRVFEEHLANVSQRAEDTEETEHLLKSLRDISEAQNQAELSGPQRQSRYLHKDTQHLVTALTEVTLNPFTPMSCSHSVSKT